MKVLLLIRIASKQISTVVLKLKLREIKGKLVVPVKFNLIAIGLTKVRQFQRTQAAVVVSQKSSSRREISN